MTIQLLICTEKTTPRRLIKWKYTALFSFLLIEVSALGSSPQVATLTQVQGTVKIFTHPSKTLQPHRAQAGKNGPPHALFENEYYLVEDAKLGSPIEKGNIVRTTPGSKARVIYPNGDQFYIGSGTAYRVTWNEEASLPKVEVNLMYGKLRGIIEKGGPRTQLLIKTKSAIMGVRGTDFFISSGGINEATQVTTIRGEVGITPRVIHKNQPIETIQVMTGFTGEVNLNAAQALQTEPKVELKKTDQRELTQIKQSVKINSEPGPKVVEPQLNQTLASLEKKATQTTLNDIKIYDKVLYENIKQGIQPGSVDDVNNAAVENLFKAAPKGPTLRKPSKGEIEDTEDGAYERYFKNEDH